MHAVLADILRAHWRKRAVADMQRDRRNRDGSCPEVLEELRGEMQAGGGTVW
jgi:hypothetical protein